jgi:hypothetical protein
MSTGVKNHLWKETGKIKVHVYYKGDEKPVVYVRCESCGQTGFIKPPSKVIYTWQPQENAQNLKK